MKHLSGVGLGTRNAVDQSMNASAVGGAYVPHNTPPVPASRQRSSPPLLTPKIFESVTSGGAISACRPPAVVRPLPARFHSTLAAGLLASSFSIIVPSHDDETISKSPSDGCL